MAGDSEPSTTDRVNWSDEVRRFLPIGWKLALRYCGDPDVGEDLLQDALLKVARSGDQFRHQCHVQTWMCRILINVCRDWRRGLLRQQHCLVSDPDWLQHHPAEVQAMPVEVQERETRLRYWVDQLPERQREIVVLSVWQEMSPAQVADCLEIQVQNVYSQLSLARQQLQTWLKREGWEPV